MKGTRRSLARPCLAIAGSLVFLSPTAANACIVFVHAKLEEIRRADAVFVGDIVSYDIVERDGPFFPTEDGSITVRVHSTIKGAVPSTVSLAWPNSTFGYPPELAAYQPAIFAATYDESGDPPYPGSSDARKSPSGKLTLFQPACSRAFMLPDSKAGEEAVRRVLAGGSATFDDLWVMENGPERMELKAIRRSESPRGAFSGVLAVTFAFLMTGLAMVWRKRRKHPA